MSISWKPDEDAHWAMKMNRYYDYNCSDSHAERWVVSCHEDGFLVIQVYFGTKESAERFLESTTEKLIQLERERARDAKMEGA